LSWCCLLGGLRGAPLLRSLPAAVCLHDREPSRKWNPHQFARTRTYKTTTRLRGAAPLPSASWNLTLFLNVSPPGRSRRNLHWEKQEHKMTERKGFLPAKSRALPQPSALSAAGFGTRRVSGRRKARTRLSSVLKSQKLTRTVAWNLRPKPPFELISPKGVLPLMGRVMRVGLGWFRMLVESTRNWTLFASAIWIVLLIAASKSQIPGLSIVFSPRFPRSPGSGFRRTTKPGVPSGSTT